MSKKARTSKIPANAFEPVATEGELMAYLSRQQALTSTASIGERFASVILTKQSKSELHGCMENAQADGVAIDLVDYLFAARESLNDRLRLVDAALARLSILGKEHQEAADV